MTRYKLRTISTGTLDSMIERMFMADYPKFTFSESRSSFPLYDWYLTEDQQSIILEFALAGYSKDEIAISENTSSGTFTLKLSPLSEEEDRLYPLHRQRKIVKKEISETFKIPPSFHLSDDMEYKDGLLTLRMIRDPENIKTHTLK